MPSSAADTATLGLVGMDAKDFVRLSDGIAETVQWYADEEWKSWKRPA